MRISDWSSDVCSSDLRLNPSLDGETQAEEPEIDPALAREEELAAARDESFQAGLEAGRTENLEAVELIIAECRALMQSLDEARTIDKAALGPMMKKADRKSVV